MIEIPLTQGQIAIVDDCDSHLASYKWNADYDRATKNYYVKRKATLLSGKRTNVRLHHAVIGFPLNGMLIDHKNGNTLDNRRDNLRIVTPLINAQNHRLRREGKTSSKYVGVWWDKNREKWHVTLKREGITIHVGRFDSEESAKDAYENYYKIHP